MKNQNSYSISSDQLKLFVERIERLAEEKQAIADDISDVYKEAKANGYDAKVLRRLVALRKLEAHELQEQQAVLSTYASAVGLQIELPL